MLLFLYCFYYSMLHVLRDFWFWQFCNLVLSVKRGLIRNIISVSVLCFRVRLQFLFLDFDDLCTSWKNHPFLGIVWISAHFFQSLLNSSSPWRVFGPPHSQIETETEAKRHRLTERRQRQRDRDQKPETQREMRNWTENSKWKLKRHGLPNGP